MSARMEAKKGIRADVAGTGRPEIAIRLRRPAVFRTTVLPPAFAPEMIITDLSRVSVNEPGTMSKPPAVAGGRDRSVPPASAGGAAPDAESTLLLLVFRPPADAGGTDCC